MAKSKLVLKEKYKGTIVKITIPKMGECEFDTNKVPESDYDQYVKMGFGHCFDTVEMTQPTEETETEETETEEVEEPTNTPLTRLDALADLVGKKRPDNPLRSRNQTPLSVEDFKILKLKEIKEIATEKGMEIAGAKKEEMIDFILSKIA